MYDKNIISKYIKTAKQIQCATAIFDQTGRILYLNEEAFSVLGDHVIDIELLPGRYVENDNFWDTLHKNKIIFTHKALLKAGTITYKIRGMVHELETGARQQDDRLYMILFELRTDHIFGSVTLENIIENAGFVAFHWMVEQQDVMEASVKYVSNSVSKFGYNRKDFYDKKINWYEFVYEEDRQMLKEQIFDNVQNQNYEFTREYRVLTKKGDVVPVHDYVHLIVNAMGQLVGVEMVIFDLTMETRRNANLLLLENAINRSHNIVLVWQYREDGEPREVRYVSSNIERFGISSTMLLSKEIDYYDYIQCEDRKKVEDVYTQFSQKGYQYLSQEYRIVNDEGQEFWIRDESNLIELPDGTKYIESILTNISDSKRREQQLLEQQESLQKKLRYVESDDSMVNDLSVTDFISQSDLQELESAVASLTKSYNAVIDLDGEPITYPEGPDTNMGMFYDMFERVEFKKEYYRLNNTIRKEHGAAMISLDGILTKKEEEHNTSLPEDGDLTTLIKAASMMEDTATSGVMVGIPLYVGEKHIATWINCAFTQTEIDQIDYYLPALQSICKYLARFVYSNTISQKQAQKARLSEVQARELLDRSYMIRDLLDKCNEDNAEETLHYVMSKVGHYLKLTRISIFRTRAGQEEYECWKEWDDENSDKDIDWKKPHISELWNKKNNLLDEKKEMVLNGDNIPLRARRCLWENQIRALVGMPLDLKMKEQYYILFIEGNYERSWDKAEISFMKTVVDLLQVFLSRTHDNVNFDDAVQTQMSLFDLSREFIYVKNMADDEIIYVNRRLEEFLGETVVGKHCYEVFRKQSIRCIDCYQQKKACTEQCNCKRYSHIFPFPVRIREMPISWDERGDMRVVMISREDIG